MIGIASAIGISLIKTLTSYLFSGYLKTHYGSVYIEGAPFWYGRESDDEICISSYKRGGINDIEIVKQDVENKLSDRLKVILKRVSETQFKNLKEDEVAYLKKIINDNKINEFVENRIYFKNIKREDDKIFVRGCIEKDDFIEFEKKRIKELSKDMSFYKSKKAFDELENDDMNLEDELK